MNRFFPILLVFVSTFSSLSFACKKTEAEAQLINLADLVNYFKTSSDLDGLLIKKIRMGEGITAVVEVTEQGTDNCHTIAYNIIRDGSCDISSISQVPQKTNFCSETK